MNRSPNLTPLENLPVAIGLAFANAKTTADLLSVLMPTLGEFFKCDRCFLYLRNPYTRQGRVPFCWVRDPAVPTIYDQTCKVEPPSLASQDPMFAAALQMQASIFVEDIETASPQVLSRLFEQETFGHRALIHAHLSLNNQLWGVLQLCMFNQPRHWTQAERQTIEQVVEILTPIVVENMANFLIH